jgi:hypothetical protein
MNPIRQLLTIVLLALLLVVNSIAPAWAFGGFYVGGASGQIFNRASQVIIARQGENTVLTLASDFRGNAKDFALVVPVPVAIQREQVGVADRAILQKLDTFTQPRLVEYFDVDPCLSTFERNTGIPRPTMLHSSVQGVSIENNFQAGEYNISILSATDSDGLETWLRRNGYQPPAGASEALRPYLRQKMKFVVAKVNLAEFNKNGSSLRPLQISYKSPKFMLPIRLGMLNAQGEQELVAYLLSSRGRVEVVNYRTVELPANMEIPEFARFDFNGFYKSTFQNSYEKAGRKVVFLEHAWHTNNCDPCTTSTLNNEELKKAGVFWQGNKPTFITRLHIRYDRSKFPEDLVFQETSNQALFQSRYALHRTYHQSVRCENNRYHRSITNRYRQQADNAVRLTGRRRQEIESQMRLNRSITPASTPGRGRNGTPITRPSRGRNVTPAITPSRDRNGTPIPRPNRGRNVEPESFNPPSRERNVPPDSTPTNVQEPDDTRSRGREKEPESDNTQNRGRSIETESDNTRNQIRNTVTESDSNRDQIRNTVTESDSNRDQIRNTWTEPDSNRNRGRDPDSGSDSNRQRSR